MPQAVRVRLVPNRLSEAHHPTGHTNRENHVREFRPAFSTPQPAAPQRQHRPSTFIPPLPFTPISFRGYKVASKNGWCHRSRCGSKSLVVFCGMPASQPGSQEVSQFCGKDGKRDKNEVDDGGIWKLKKCATGISDCVRYLSETISIRHCGIMGIQKETGLRYQGICDYGYNLEF